MALARYKLYRGARPENDPLPDGLRQDTRHRTKHCLRPTREIVETYLSTPDKHGKVAWKTFEQRYRALLEQRFAEDRIPFDQLAELAREQDVYFGCNCPTKKNPELSCCHTILALRFMKRKFPNIDVRFPAGLKA